MDELESLGSWWLPSNPQEKIQGVIKVSSEKKISLEIVGSSTERNFLNIASENQKIIIGVTPNELFTLLNCYQTTRKVSSRGIITQSYYVNRALVGHHFNSLEEIKFDKFEVSFTDIKYYSLFRWNTNLFSDINSDTDEKNFQISFIIKDLKANIQQAKISINPVVEREITPQEISVNSKALIEVDIDSKKSLDEIFSLFINPLNDFLTLAANRANYITELNFILENGVIPLKIKHIFRIPNYTNTTNILHPHEVLLNLDDIKEHFSLVMQKWFNLFDTEKDIINLYFSTIYNPYLYQENKLLSLVQTLESYHRRKIDKRNSSTEEHKTRLDDILAATPEKHKKWLTEKLNFSHEPSLFERLTEIFNLTKKTLNPLVTDSKTFIKKVKNIRNYLTHYSENSQQKQYNAKTLLIINQILDFMIKACLLTELGYSPECCEKSICRSQEYQNLKKMTSENSKLFL